MFNSLLLLLQFDRLLQRMLWMGITYVWSHVTTSKKPYLGTLDISEDVSNVLNSKTHLASFKDEVRCRTPRLLFFTD